MTDVESPLGPLDDERPTMVFLGNRGAADYYVDEKKLAKMTAEQVAEQGVPSKMVPVDVPKACTRVVLEPGISLLEAMKHIADPGRVWSRVSTDAAPVWVASSDPMLAQVLAQHYGAELREVDLDHGQYVNGADDAEADDAGTEA